MYREWKKIEIPPKKVLYTNFETIRPRGRPRNKWQRWGERGWKNSWRRRVVGKST
jgi:hypothetical protein